MRKNKAHQSKVNKKLNSGIALHCDTSRYMLAHAYGHFPEDQILSEYYSRTTEIHLILPVEA